MCVHKVVCGKLQTVSTFLLSDYPNFTYCGHLLTKKSTIHDIARALNITASTVSRALNDHPRISVETKRLVREAASSIGYRVNGVASALRSGRTFTLGIVVPTADRSFFAGVVRGVEAVANRAGYNVMICQSNESYQAEMKDINALVRAQVDGIILSVAKETTDYAHFAQLQAWGVPLVLFDRVPPHTSASTVTVDDYSGGYRATEHLIQQGCRRIATLTSSHAHLLIYQERLRGYQDALRAHGLAVRNEYIVRCDLDIVSGTEAAAALWALPEPPEAIFCESDLSALGALQYFKGKGIRVPTDVALAGFANEPFTAYVSPALTTVTQYPIEMGQTAAQLFLEQMEATNNQPFTPKHVRLNADLIVRESSLWKKA